MLVFGLIMSVIGFFLSGVAYQRYVFYDNNVESKEDSESDDIASKELGRFFTYMIVAILCMIFVVSSAIKQGLKL